MISNARNSIIWLLGALEALVMSFPPSNADGSPNYQAQTDAIYGLLDGLWSNQFPALVQSGLELPQVKAVAMTLVNVIEKYKAATSRPTL